MANTPLQSDENSPRVVLPVDESVTLGPYNQPNIQLTATSNLPLPPPKESALPDGIVVTGVFNVKSFSAKPRTPTSVNSHIVSTTIFEPDVRVKKPHCAHEKSTVPRFTSDNRWCNIDSEWARFFIISVETEASVVIVDEDNLLRERPLWIGPDVFHTVSRLHSIFDSHFSGTSRDESSL
ncbi:hypothetical protein SBOR_4366 [Sclerotinia borealis F-4128]|uniref:Uncharacterized protein n=1 Tax=Sclerotinia borealis (strain F-4128) TaxID=1432307 RepID=W9CKS5_SCLBF|nr:hypothetical protein SBOR_4366 [Sclerotinia borealis F-4128]